MIIPLIFFCFYNSLSSHYKCLGTISIWIENWQRLGNNNELELSNECCKHHRMSCCTLHLQPIHRWHHLNNPCRSKNLPQQILFLSQHVIQRMEYKHQYYLINYIILLILALFILITFVDLKFKWSRIINKTHASIYLIQKCSFRKFGRNLSRCHLLMVLGNALLKR